MNLNQVDEDRSGTVDFEEFYAMIQKAMADNSSGGKSPLVRQ